MLFSGAHFFSLSFNAHIISAIFSHQIYLKHRLDIHFAWIAFGFLVLVLLLLLMIVAIFVGFALCRRYPLSIRAHSLCCVAISHSTSQHRQLFSIFIYSTQLYIRFSFSLSFFVYGYGCGCVVSGYRCGDDCNFITCPYFNHKSVKFVGKLLLMDSL